MAQKVKFHEGWSGSGKHTGTMGDGSQMGGGPASAPSKRGPNANVGAEGRFRATWDKGMGGNGAPSSKGMKTYNQE
jgi:hypothetical protein